MSLYALPSPPTATPVLANPYHGQKLGGLLRGCFGRVQSQEWGRGFSPKANP